MKSKLFRTLSLILAASAVITLTGCGNKNEKQTDKGSSTAAPKIEKVSSFKYFNMATGKTKEEFNASPLSAMIKEQTGYTVTYDQAPADPKDAETAVMNVFMSRADYQAVKVTKNQFYSLLATDALKDITPYVNSSTNLKTQISQFGWQTASKDGKIYAIPQKDAAMVNSVAIAYRLDWLKEYNAANPSAQIDLPSEKNGYSMTITDFKKMLTYFKGKVPQNGKALAIDINGVFLENILPAFGIYQEWADVNGKLQYYINQPGFEDYMKYIQGLYDDGLINYQATSGDAGVVKLLQSKSIGAGRVPHWNGATIEKNDAAATDPNIGYISALVPDNAKGDASKVRVFALEGYSYYTVIPKYSTDSQAASVVDFADKKLEKDFFLKLTLGTEGETYKVDNGKYYPILPKFDTDRGISDKFLDGTREEEYSKYWLCRVRKAPAQDKLFSIANYNVAATGIKSPVTVMPPNAVYDSSYSAADTEVKTALVKSLYKKDGRQSLSDIQKVFANNKGNDITTAVNDWYGKWAEKANFNKVKGR